MFVTFWLGFMMPIGGIWTESVDPPGATVNDLAYYKICRFSDQILKSGLVKSCGQ